MTNDEQDRRNKDVLRHAFDIYRDGMRPFLIRMLKKVPGLSLEDAIRQALNGRSLESFEYAIGKGEDISETFDIGEFPELIRHHWNRVFAEYFGDYTQVTHDTRQLRTIRNALAHGKLKNLKTVAALEFLSIMARVLGSINESTLQAEIESEINTLNSEDSMGEIEQVDETIEDEVEPSEMATSSEESGDTESESGEQSDQDNAPKELTEGLHHDFKVAWIQEKEASNSGQPYFKVDFVHGATGELVFRNYSLLPQSIPYLAILMDEFGVDTEGLEDVLDSLEARSRVYQRLRKAIRGKTVSLQLVRHEWNGMSRLYPERVMNPEPLPASTP